MRTTQEKIIAGAAAAKHLKFSTSLELYRELGKQVGENWQSIRVVPDVVCDIVAATPNVSLVTLANACSAAINVAGQTSSSAPVINLDAALKENSENLGAQASNDIRFLASELAKVKDLATHAGQTATGARQRADSASSRLDTFEPDVTKKLTSLGKETVTLFNQDKAIEQSVKDLEDKLTDQIKKVGAMQMTVTVTQAPSPVQPTVTINNAHPALGVVLEGINKGLRNFYLWGPAGSGKSTLARQVAEALGFDIGAQSFTADSSEMSLLGFMAADGVTYNASLLREYWGRQAVFLADELDNLADNVAVVINDGLANGKIKFPDGVLQRHPDQVTIGTGNTNMGGATSGYGARVRQDGATRQRWQFIHVGYDEHLEETLCRAIDSKVTDEFLPWFRQVRKFAIDNVLPTSFIVSPREAIYHTQWFKGGTNVASLESILHAGLWKGLDPATIRSIVDQLGLPKITGVKSIAKANPEAVYDSTKI